MSYKDNPFSDISREEDRDYDKKQLSKQEQRRNTFRNKVKSLDKITDQQEWIKAVNECLRYLGGLK